MTLLDFEITQQTTRLAFRLAGVGVVLFVLRLIWHLKSSPLNKYPGPYLATISDFWKYSYVKSHRGEVTTVKLHDQYGSIVRVGPNKLSFGSPSALKDIYGVNKGYVKVQLLDRADQLYK